MPHTIAKLRNIDKASVLFHKVGFRPAPFFVVLASLMEFVAAVGLVSGLFPRVGAVIGAMVLAGAAYAIVRANGLMWRWQHPGIEYIVFWAAMMLSLTFLA